MRPSNADGLSRSQATLEFALTVPIIVLIILGIFDFARAIWYYNTLAEAAQEGTRYAIVHGSTSASPVGPGANDAALRDVVRGFGFGMDTSEVRVLSTWPNGTNGPGNPVTVEVGYTYVPLTTMILGGVSVPLTSTSEASIVY